MKFGRVVCVVKWKFDNIACELIRVWNWRMETYFLSSNCTLTNTVFILLDTYIFFFQINDNGCCCFCWLVDDVKFFPLINPFEMVIQFGIEQIVFWVNPLCLEKVREIFDTCFFVVFDFSKNVNLLLSFLKRKKLHSFSFDVKKKQKIYHNYFFY